MVPNVVQIPGELRELVEKLMLNGAQQSAPPAVECTQTGKPRVLIVDDSDDVRDIVSTAVRLADLEPVTACNGVEAVIAAHRTHPTVVLMDLSMPQLDGISATRLLKASVVTRNIPVIAYTATPSLCDEVAAEQLFAQVLPKPADPDLVVAQLRRFTPV